MTKIYTKSGDDGTTALGGGIRVSKHDIRVEAYGTVDELNSILGAAMAFQVTKKLHSQLTQIQNWLFDAGADLAFSHSDDGWKPVRIKDSHIQQLERWIDEWQSGLPELRYFILPGGSQAAALLHMARTVCRRAERLIVKVVDQEQNGEKLLQFINRLSDLLFVMARGQNQSSQVDDVIWKPDE